MPVSAAVSCEPAASPGRARRSRLLRLAVLGATALLAASCGMLPDVRPRPEPGRPAPPIADVPINLAGQCARTEDDGFREQASVRIVDNRVEQLSWQLWVGRKGSCRFEGADFQQTKFRPSIEMVARDGSGCRLLVWQDPRRVTVAHNGCERRCTPGIYESAWPVMFEPRGGGCATGR